MIQPILKSLQFWKLIHLVHFLLCNLLDIFAPWPQNGGSSGSTLVYVEGSLQFSHYTYMHYVIGWCHVVVAVNSPMLVNAWSCMNVFGTSNNKYYRRGRCGMSDVAFRTAPPIGVLSCLYSADQIAWPVKYYTFPSELGVLVGHIAFCYSFYPANSTLYNTAQFWIVAVIYYMPKRRSLPF